jgi:hypothetical protein
MSLIAPFFLAGLLAVGIPWWLHRLSSDNPNRRPFSSVMFLEAGEPQRVLAKKVQYLLLLAFRIAVIVALVLAFIQPAFWRDPAAGAVGDQRLHVIVVDTSASMGAGDRWDEAGDAVLDIIDSSTAADQVQVIAAGRQLEIVTDATLDKAVARQGLQTLEPGVFHVDFGQLTRSLDGILRTAGLPVVLHFVTDAQATGLPTRFAELAPTEPVEIVVHAVTDEATPNWAVEGLTGSALSGELAATVTSYAATEATKTLRLELNGGVVDEQSVTLEPGQQAVVEFAALELEEGANRVRVVMSPGDALAGDDVRMLALNRPVPHPVLLVSGGLTGTGDTLFLETTMGILEGLVFDVTKINAANLRDEDFDDYEFVVVTDAAALDSRAADRLEAWVRTGGGLLLALGSRSTQITEVPVTGHAFASRRSPLASGPAATVSVGAIETSHPALSGVDTIRAARYYNYAALEETAGDEVLIRLQTGDPLLLEHALGNGRLLVYTSSLDREWNELPKEPAFVPFVAGMADYLLGGAGFSNEAALGSALALQAMGLQGGQIYDPEGDLVLGLQGAGTDVLLERIGFYELAGGGRIELVAVNFDVRESSLAPADAGALTRWQGLGRAAAPATGSGTALSEEVLVPVGYWILLILLLAAIVESGLGNWHLRVRRGIAA